MRVPGYNAGDDQEERKEQFEALLDRLLFITTQLSLSFCPAKRLRLKLRLRLNQSLIRQPPITSWGFEGNENGSSSHGMLPDLGQNSQPLSSQYSGVLELSQQGKRQQHMELGHTRGYDSTTAAARSPASRRVSPQTHHFNPFISPDSSRVEYHKVQKQRKQTRKVQAFSSKHHQLFPHCLLALFLQLYILLQSADDLKLVYFKAGTSCKNSSHALNKKAMEKSSFRDNSNSKIFSFSMPSKG
ncbi:hypothetical protein ACFX1Q_024893 [Malus domestica]